MMHWRCRDAYFCGVVLDVSDDVRAEAYRLVSEIRARVDTITFSDDARPPHVTLFQGLMPGGVSPQEIALCASQVHESFRDALLPFDDVLFFRPNGNVFWNVRCTDMLQDLHERLVSVLRPLTGGLLIEKYRAIAESEDASDVVREHLVRYGTMLAGPDFLPHITLANVDSALHVQLAGLHPVPCVMRPVALRVALLRDDGSVLKYLA